VSLVPLLSKIPFSFEGRNEVAGGYLDISAASGRGHGANKFLLRKPHN